MKMVKWGVLGTAGIARGCTIPGMKLAENCELYAVAGRSLEKAEQFQKDFGFEKAYGSLEALLEDPEVEAVYIPLPNHMHYEWVMKAIAAGKNILCEKPLAPSAQQAKELYAAAKEKGVILMEAFAYLHTPYIKALQDEIAAGTIGEVRYIETAFLTSDYDVSNIRMRKETYGGATYDLGCYCTTMILRMLGKMPVKVQALAEFSDENVDRFTSAYLTFDGGLRAAFECGMVFETGMDRRWDRLFIHGSKGSIRSLVEYNEAGDLTYTVWKNGESEVKTVPVRQNYSLEIEQLGRCITEGESRHVEEEFSVMNAELLDQVLAAIQY